jgi:hypothetical protein
MWCTPTIEWPKKMEKSVRIINFMSTLSSLRSSLWHYNRCQLWPKYDSNVVLDLLQRKIWRPAGIKINASLLMHNSIPPPLKGLKAYNTISYNANMQVKIKVLLNQCAYSVPVVHVRYLEWDDPIHVHWQSKFDICSFSLLTPKFMYFISSLILLRFFPSDLPVVLIIQRFKKKVKKSRKGPTKKKNKCQTWITSVHVWDRFILQTS